MVLMSAFLVVGYWLGVANDLMTFGLPSTETKNDRS
jgi:hypothetical protein